MDHKVYLIGYINIGANEAGGVWIFNRGEFTDKTGNWSGIYRTVRRTITNEGTSNIWGTYYFFVKGTPLVYISLISSQSYLFYIYFLLNMILSKY